MNKSESIKEIATALSQAQGEFPQILKDKENPYYKSKYADISSIHKAVNPVLAKHGLAIAQITNPNAEVVEVETVLLHNSGEWISSTIQIKPVKTDPQAYGSALTYARRYALSAILNISSEDDDDGNAASKENGKDVKKEVPKEKPLPTLTEKAYGTILARILAGETDLIEKTEKAFTITEEQKINLTAAVKTAQAAKVQKQAPETPDTTPKAKSDDKKIFE